MLSVKLNITSNDAAMRAALGRLTQDGPKFVDVGAFSKKSGALQVKIDAIHEFGGTINHPGGTPYGYASLKDRLAKRVSFLKKGGSSYFVLGVTRPHRITIPPRPYIRPTVAKNRDAYARYVQRLAERVVEGESDKAAMLGLLGQRVQADVRKTIRALKTPPLKAATIRHKGSDKPLIDHGNLLRSINYQVDDATA